MFFVFHVLCLLFSCGFVFSSAPSYSDGYVNCGGVYQGDVGEIVSPGWPSRYQGRRRCVYEIRVLPGRNVTLQFSSFRLQARRRRKCKDRVEVYDGDNKIGDQYCAREIASSRVFTSTSNRITVTFKSDRRKNFPGFKGTYASTGCGDPVVPRAPWSAPWASGNKIVGGNEAAPGSYPWQISLRRTRPDGYYHICGASLLSESWAITAAHCIVSGLGWAVAGEHNRDQTSSWQQTVKLQKAFKHPAYDGNTFENDIALLKLQTPVSLNDRVRPVCLPDPSWETSAGTIITVTGWGTLAESGRSSHTLQQADMPIEDDDRCVNVYNRLAAFGYPRVYPAIMMCAGYRRGGVDTCQGDSGGPVVATSPGGTAYLAGVTSFGYGCGRQNAPGVNTRVSAYVDWIRQTMENNP